MNDTNLSVIFACRDRGDLLDRTLSAWRNQDTDINIELIVVDDGSNPPLEEIAGKHGATYMTVTPNPKRGGPSIAWNAGLRAAHGQVLACSGPEMLPDRRCARYLHDVPMGLGGFKLYLWDGADVKHPDLLRNRAIRVSIPMFSLAGHHDPDSVDWKSDPIHLRELPSFWDTTNPNLEGRTNPYILNVRGWMSHGLFSIRAEVWKWMNYMRPSDNYGVDDIELTIRRHFLGIAWVHCEDTPFAYHQWHSDIFRAAQSDLHNYTDCEDARLVWLYPETANQPCPLRNDFVFDELLCE